MRKRLILVARYYSIEPLGILYLAGAARDLGWDCKIVLVREFDFEPVYDAIRSWQPDLVGFQIWTGYHIPAFAACDRVRAMGVPVVIGGPHATYFDKDCATHADWVVKGGGFGLFRKVLLGLLPAGMSFDINGREEAFPLPDRDTVYEAYPELGASPIKSIFGSVGCPFTCTYCYAPSFNEMHGGFKLTVRPVADIVAEAKAIMKRWPLKMVYFQDDIFGYDRRWLEEFAQKWKDEVGVPFHCQIRLELTRNDIGSKRLDLFAQAGCSGITLAIESGNAFLRDYVLFRHMPDELIVEGCRKILDRGMTLRTEQILAVPFSDVFTDLATLDLNNRINPTMAWTSILAPYAGTNMGKIASNFGFYGGNNDDLSETFFDRSILRHVEGGPLDMAAIVQGMGAGAKEHPLLGLKAVAAGGQRAEIVASETGETLGSIYYLDRESNEKYCEQTVRLQRLFNWLSRVPDAAVLGRKLTEVPTSQWSWEEIGRLTTLHLKSRAPLDRWAEELALEMGLSSPAEFPAAIAANPWYFCFLPAGGEFAKAVLEQGVFDPASGADRILGRLGTMTRRHLFDVDLYKIVEGSEAIAGRRARALPVPSISGAEADTGT
ncbi:MAG: B12-binding domain-containing radical SAM protein [Stellaceae bacterium]